MGKGRLAYYVMDRLLTFSRVDATICDCHKSARGAAFYSSRILRRWPALLDSRLRRKPRRHRNARGSHNVMSGHRKMIKRQMH